MAKKKSKGWGKAASTKRSKSSGQSRSTTTRSSSRTNGSGRTAKRAARQPSLPGTEQVRDAKLDDICSDIGDGLDQITAGTAAVDEGKASAAQRLHVRGLQAYRHAGVRVTLVPGAERVSVKREKEREINVSIGAGVVDQTDRGDDGGDSGDDLDVGETL